jgi:hypothetical protein
MKIENIPLMISVSGRVRRVKRVRQRVFHLQGSGLLLLAEPRPLSGRSRYQAGPGEADLAAEAAPDGDGCRQGQQGFWGEGDGEEGREAQTGAEGGAREGRHFFGGIGESDGVAYAHR